jgi:hypothetical protein
MFPVSSASPFRMDKRKVDATLTLTSGRTVRGAFFAGENGAFGDGPERIDDLLNQASGRAGGFFAFARLDTVPSRVVLYNTAHVSVIALDDREARDVPGYEVAPVRQVELTMSNGDTVRGEIRVYLPDGRNRVSDWAREPDTFRSLEVGRDTVLVNIHHVVEIRELEHP